MGTRYPNPGLVKVNYPYRVDEIARKLAVHPNTVRSWFRVGLLKIDERRPIMVRGYDLRAFLEQRRRAAKTACPPGHLYCFKCRAPRMPAEKMADYILPVKGAGNLTGLCSVCERWMKRRVSAAQLPEWQALLDITIRRQE
jgi:hypothetical protein